MLFAITQDLNMLRHKNNCGHCDLKQLLLPLWSWWSGGLDVLLGATGLSEVTVLVGVFLPEKESKFIFFKQLMYL